MNSVLQDDVERGIARHLAADGRASTAEMARALGVTDATVRRKLNRLLDEGLLSVRAVVDPLRQGPEIGAVIGLDVDRAHVPAVTDRLAQYPFVSRIYAVTGPYDLLIEVTLGSLTEMYAFLFDELDDIEGIKDSHSFMIGRVFKNNGLLRGDAIRAPRRAARTNESAKELGK